MAFAPTRKPHWTGLPVTHKNGDHDFGAISVTGRSRAAPICASRIGYFLCHTLNRYSDRSSGEKENRGQEPTETEENIQE